MALAKTNTDEVITNRLIEIIIDQFLKISIIQNKNSDL